MKQVIKYLVLPFLPVVALADCVLWNLCHQFGMKTNVQTSAREIWEAWKRW